MEQGEWLMCKADPDFEIYSVYPYQLRRRADGLIVYEWKLDTGYVQCALNGKNWLKHRIVAIQFLDNPLGLSQVDHINHIRDDNRSSNLRWVSRRDNQRNRSGYKGKPYVFLKQLPPSAELLESYKDHELNSVFIDRIQKKLYEFNGVCYRELVPYKYRGHYYYYAYDTEDRRIHLSHTYLFKEDE